MTISFQLVTLPSDNSSSLMIIRLLVAPPNIGRSTSARQRAPDRLAARTMSPSPPEARWAPSLGLGTVRQGRGPSRSGGLADHSGPCDMACRLLGAPRRSQPLKSPAE